MIICGLPGTGKTSLANAIAPLLNAEVLSTDKFRKELIEHPKYSKQERRLIYDVMLIVARYLHNAGINCILDATFNTERSRGEARKKLALQPFQIHIVECVCPENVVMARLRRRKGDYSDADISVYKKMKKIYEPVQEEHTSADTSISSPENIARNIAHEILKKLRS